MRHLFFVHSNITYLVARQVIRTQELPLADCGLLLARNFQPTDSPVATAPLPNVLFPLTLAVWRTRRKIALVDAVIDELTHTEEFELYCPHTDNNLTRLAVTHPRCAGVSYIEEGMATYAVKGIGSKPFSVKHSVLGYALSGGRLPHLSFYEASYRRAYGIHELAFPDLARKTVVGLPFGTAIGTPPLDDAQILVFDALIEQHVATPQKLADTLLGLFERYCAAGVRQVYVKYHPMQAGNPALQVFYQELMARYAGQIEFRELPAAVVLEDVAYTYRNVTFTVIVSSVGFYARLCGQPVYSVARLLAEADPLFRQTSAKLMPPVFFDVVECL